MKRTLILLATATLIGLMGSAMAASFDVQGGTAAPSASNKYAAKADHQVVVNLPTVVALNIVGDSTSNTTLTFDVTASDFYKNVYGDPTTAGNPKTTLSPATGGFQELQAFTNDPAGAALTVGYTASSQPAGATTAEVDQVINDVTVGTASLPTINPTIHGLKTVFTRNDVTLKLQGTELPGSYTYTVTYTLTAQ